MLHSHFIGILGIFLISSFPFFGLFFTSAARRFAMFCYMDSFELPCPLSLFHPSSRSLVSFCRLGLLRPLLVSSLPSVDMSGCVFNHLAKLFLCASFEYKGCLVLLSCVSPVSFIKRSFARHTRFHQPCITYCSSAFSSSLHLCLNYMRVRLNG